MSITINITHNLQNQAGSPWGGFGGGSGFAPGARFGFSPGGGFGFGGFSQNFGQSFGRGFAPGAAFGPGARFNFGPGNGFGFGSGLGFAPQSLNGVLNAAAQAVDSSLSALCNTLRGDECGCPPAAKAAKLAALASIPSF